VLERSAIRHPLFAERSINAQYKMKTALVALSASAARIGIFAAIAETDC